MPAPRRRRPVVLVLLVELFLLVAGGEGYVILQQNGRLDRADQQATADRTAADKRAKDLDSRVKALEQRLAGSLDSAAVATAVLPSVFRVDAGQFTGTAFAVGKEPAGGGTDLITNYHVIQSIYEKGTKDAALERDSQRFPVKITQVDQKDDLALLHSTETFHRLASASAQVQAGAPIVVVGAPLGLAQTVTTGVVSAIRNDFPGEGGKTFIQFDAPINPGNSGGPVVDAQKQVVGIASAKANNAEGIGLAIPIAMACQAFSIC
jgi:S1-C subfamily serine protease